MEANARKESAGKSVKAKRLMAPYVGGLAWPTVFMTGLLALAFAVVHASVALGQLGYFSAMLICSVLVYLMFTPLHEAAHGNVGGSRKRAWIDIIVGRVAGICMYAPFSAFKTLHLTHHRYTNHADRDPDYWVATRKPFALFWRCLTIHPHYFYFLLTNPSVPRPAMIKAMTVFIGMNVLAFGAVSVGWLTWQHVVFVYIIPAQLGLALNALVFDWLPHVPHESKDADDNTRVIFGQFLNVLSCGQSVHQVHHLMPSIPFYKYHSAGLAARPFLNESRIALVPVTPTQPPPQPLPGSTDDTKKD